MRLRAVTFNIHKCVGGIDRRCRPERIRDAVRPADPDLLLLQEVADEGGWRQSEHLGDLLGLRHRTWFPNVTLRRGRRYGNAILSRFPITASSNIDLTHSWEKRRSVLHARVRACRPGGRPRTLHVYAIHLALLQGLRRRQLARFLASKPLTDLHPRAPVLVGGDFNDVWGTLGPQVLAPAGFRGSDDAPRTFPAWAPLRPLDAVYVRGDARLLRVEPLKTPASRWASDHLPLVTDVELL